MKRKVRFKCDIGGEPEGTVREVRADGLIEITVKGFPVTMPVDAFPQLFEEVPPTLKEIRLIPLGRADLGEAVPMFPNYYLRDTTGRLLPARCYAYEHWHDEYETFRLEEVYE